MEFLKLAPVSSVADGEAVSLRFGQMPTYVSLAETFPVALALPDLFHRISGTALDHA